MVESRRATAGGLTDVALLEPSAVPLFEANKPWLHKAYSNGELYAPGPGALMKAAAALLLFEGEGDLVPDFWAYGMVVNPRDGCPSNCLARNMDVRPKGLGGIHAPAWAAFLEQRAAAGRPLPPGLQPSADAFWTQLRAREAEAAEAEAEAQRRREQRAAEQAAQREVRKREMRAEREQKAKAAASAAVARLYGELGREQARLFLAGLQRQLEEQEQAAGEA